MSVDNITTPTNTKPTVTYPTKIMPPARESSPTTLQSGELTEAEKRIVEQLRLLPRSDTVFAHLPAMLIECLDIMLSRGEYNSKDFGVEHQNYRHGDIQAFLVASRPVFRLDGIFQNNGKNLSDNIANDKIQDTINGFLIWGCLRKVRAHGQAQGR